MRKLIQYILLVAGIVLLVYSVATPLIDAADISPIAPPGSSLSYRWSVSYRPLTYVGGGILLVSVLLLWSFRKSSSRIGAAPAALISSGVMLELSCFLQIWDAAMVVDSASYLDGLLSTLPYTAPLAERIQEACSTQSWMIVLGLALVAAGIVAWLREKRNQEEEPVAEEAAPAKPEIVEEAPVMLEREEWRITLLCTVMDIRGDYALVKYDGSGVESEVAIALLPFGIDVGDRLKYENYEFETV